MERGFAPVDINDLLPESRMNDAKKAGESILIQLHSDAACGMSHAYSGSI